LLRVASTIGAVKIDARGDLTALSKSWRNIDPSANSVFVKVLFLFFELQDFFIPAAAPRCEHNARIGAGSDSKVPGRDA
jgi:hypothetical protein